MKEITASGQTVEEAVRSALEQLNTTKDHVEVEVIDEGKRGLLGVFGSKPAVVKVTKKENRVEYTKKFIHSVTKQMNVPVEIVVTVEDNHVHYDLSGEKIAMLIGKHGQTLNALQYLVQLVLNKGSDQFYTVTVDAEGYRQRRRETLQALAEKMANKAVRLQKKVALEPMPAFERKIIHHVLQNNGSISTYSDGVDPHRHIVIKPL